jgi:predicted RNase H-like HicB family nuclease
LIDPHFLIGYVVRVATLNPMDPLAFKIECDVEGGIFVASWDDPEGGGITTQAKNLTELAEAIKEAVCCHFAGRSAPREVTLHFERDPVLQLA